MDPIRRTIPATLRITEFALDVSTMESLLASTTAVEEDCGCDGSDALDSDTTTFDTAEAIAPSAEPVKSMRWKGVIGVEGELTGDGRFIQPGALRWENLPIPLRYVSADVGAHSGAVVVGRIESIYRNEETGEIEAEGDFDSGSEVAMEAARQVDQNLMRGVSMDLDDVAFEVRIAADAPALMNTDPKELAKSGTPDENGRVKVQEMAPDDEVMVTTGARVRAATIVAVPAFSTAQISIYTPTTVSLRLNGRTFDIEQPHIREGQFNWVDDVGGLPKYIKRIEKHLREKGMDEGHAIAVAVNVCKKACATGDLNFPGKQSENPKSRAEACKAVAEWEEKKARAKADSSETQTMNLKAAGFQTSPQTFSEDQWRDPHSGRWIDMPGVAGQSVLDLLDGIGGDGNSDLTDASENLAQGIHGFENAAEKDKPGFVKQIKGAIEDAVNAAGNDPSVDQQTAQDIKDTADKAKSAIDSYETGYIAKESTDIGANDPVLNGPAQNALDSIIGQSSADGALDLPQTKNSNTYRQQVMDGLITGDVKSSQKALSDWLDEIDRHSLSDAWANALAQREVKSRQFIGTDPKAIEKYLSQNCLRPHAKSKGEVRGAIGPKVDGWSENGPDLVHTSGMKLKMTPGWADYPGWTIEGPDGWRDNYFKTHSGLYPVTGRDLRDPRTLKNVASYAPSPNDKENPNPKLRDTPSSPGTGTDAAGNPAPDNIDLTPRADAPPENTGPDWAGMSDADLLDMAESLNIPGAGGMTRNELIEAIQSTQGMHAAEVLLAAAAPRDDEAPPVAHFSNPNLKGPTPLTVTDDGRVFGHLATWGTCHLSHTQKGKCITPPKSAAGYAYFHTGSVLTKEGAEVPVGHITLNTRHAKDDLRPAQTLAHYDHTGLAVADVVAGEDSYGIWVSGSLRPGMTAKSVRALRASPLSGDWRRIGTGLELVAALAVNVPGFPVPRPKGRVANGSMTSLVAAGMLAPEKVRRPGTPGALSNEDLRYLKRLAERERAEEQQEQMAVLDRAQALARRLRAQAMAARIRQS